MHIECFAAFTPKEPLKPYQYEPKELGPHDIEVQITHCGICHSDISLIDNEWGMSAYPLVPGHEIVGTVSDIGKDVCSKMLNKRIGIGWQRSSCMCCSWCETGQENLCFKQQATCVNHFGGYATHIRTDSRFAFEIPDELDSAEVAPLFCGGATVFSPLLHHNITPMSRVGIIGIGGLGHLAIQFAKPFGCEICAFTSNPAKHDQILAMGAHKVVSSVTADELHKVKNSFDFLLCTTPFPLDWTIYLELLRPKGILCFVGAQTKPIEVPFFGMIFGRKTITASNIGSRPDIKTLLSFVTKHKIKPEIEVFPWRDVNRAIDKVRRGEVRYRAVLEM